LIQIHLIRLLIFILLVHVLDDMLQDEKVGPITPVYFDAVFIVPLDDSPDLLAVR
jgi:hypothetical protein